MPWLEATSIAHEGSRVVLCFAGLAGSRKGRCVALRPAETWWCDRRGVCDGCGPRD